MILPDVNVIIYAYNVGAPRHPEYREWLMRMVNGAETYAVSELVLSSVIRIMTQVRFFSNPSSTAEAVQFVEPIRRSPSARIIHPGPKHWDVFVNLCASAGISSAKVSDAYLAAIAIEHDCEFLTADRDFARFPGLRYRSPLD